MSGMYGCGAVDDDRVDLLAAVVDGALGEPGRVQRLLPTGNDALLVSSVGVPAQQVPNQAMSAFSRIGTIESAMKVYDPTTATTFSCVACRAQSSAPGATPRSSHVMTSSGRPLTPPLSLTHCPKTLAVSWIIGNAGPSVLTDATVITLIGSPDSSPADCDPPPD